MRKIKRPIFAVIIACLLVLTTGIIVAIFPPSTPFVEILVLGLLSVGLSILASWIVGRKRIGVILAAFIIILLIMSRLQILNWVTLGLWVIVAGLISLIN